MSDGDMTPRKALYAAKRYLENKGIKNVDVTTSTNKIREHVPELEGVPKPTLQHQLGSFYDPKLPDETKNPAVFLANKQKIPLLGDRPISKFTALHEAGHAANYDALGRLSTPAFYLRKYAPLAGILSGITALRAGSPKLAPWLVGAGQLPVLADEFTASGRALAEIGKEDGYAGIKKAVPDAASNLGVYGLGAALSLAPAIYFARRALRK